MAQTVPVAYEDATSSYRARVRSCLVTLGESCPGYDPDADMAAMAEYIESSERAGFDPGACAGIVYATQHHMHAVATVGIAAEEDGEKTWLVEYNDKNRKPRKVRVLATNPNDALTAGLEDADKHGWGPVRSVKVTPEKHVRIAAGEEPSAPPSLKWWQEGARWKAWSRYNQRDLYEIYVVAPADRPAAPGRFYKGDYRLVVGEGRHRARDLGDHASLEAAQIAAAKHDVKMGTSSGPPTFAGVKESLNERGIVITRGLDGGEYKVNFRRGTDATAYYTNDLQDALLTGLAMADQQQGGARERDEPYDLPEASPETRVDLDRSVTKMLVSHADVTRAPWRVTLLDVKGREIAEATDDSLQLAFDKAMRSAIKQGFSVPVYLQDGFAQKYGAMPSASKMKGGYFGEWPAKDLDEEAAEKKRHRNPVATDKVNEYERARLVAKKYLERDGVRYDELRSYTGLMSDFRFGAYRRGSNVPVATVLVTADKTRIEKDGRAHVYSKGFAANESTEDVAIEAHEEPVVVATQKTITETTVIAAEEQAACPCEHGDQLAAEDAPTKMKTLRWHRRDPSDLKSKGVEVIGDSYFTLGILGEYIVAKRTPDRRHGKLPYVLWLNGKPLSERGFDTKGDAQEFACAYDSVIPFVAPKDTPVEVSSDGRALIGGRKLVESCLPWVRVTVDPEKLASCKTDKIIDGPRDVYDLMLIKGEDGKLVQYMSTMDQETYIVVMLDVRGGVRGVTEVARGQRSKVYVDPVDILRPVIITGASSFYCLHQHPSGDPTVSASDKRLTKAIKKATEAAAPDVEFMGHYVIVDGAYADCDSGKVTKVR